MTTEAALECAIAAALLNGSVPGKDWDLTHAIIWRHADPDFALKLLDPKGEFRERIQDSSTTHQGDPSADS